MCLIIRTEKEKLISRELMDHFATRNGDGWGMMWIQANHIKTLKGQGSDKDGLYNEYLRLREFNPMIHLRWRTHGDISHINTHPFYCGNGIYMMHNGVVSQEIRENDKSDTWHLAEDYLKPLFKKAKNPHEMIRHEDFRKAFEKVIGNSNRIALGDRGGFVL